MIDDENSHDHLDATVDTGLTAAGDRIDVGDPAAALGSVRATVKQRRRRRQVLSGVAAVGVLGAAGLVYVAVAGNTGDDRIVSAPPTDPPPAEAAAPDPSDADAATADGESDASRSAETATSTVPAAGVLAVAPSNAETVLDAGLVVAQPGGVETRLFPWQGGFLAVYTEFGSQPLPAALPPEIAEQFPPEVVELFPDGLPPTIDEAIEILTEADLLDVVTDIIVANSDVNDAIYAEPSAATTTVRFSPDGSEWSDVETDFPVDLGQFPTMASSGDRLVVAATVGDDPVADAPFVREPTAVEMWSSTDLITWELQTITLPERPADLPDFMRATSHVSSVTVADGGWLASVGTYTNLDETALLDDEQRERIESGEVYVGGMGWDDSSVTIELFEPGIDGPGVNGPGDDREVIEITWDELGFEAPSDGDGSNTTYAARWGEAPSISDTGSTSRFGFDQFVALEDGFLALGSDLRLSSDGVSWSPVALPVSGFVEWAIDTDDGLIVAGRGDAGAAFSYRFEPSTSEFSPIELGELPGGASPQQMGGRSVVLGDYGDAGGFSSGGSIGVAESNGYRFELEVSFSPASTTISYVLTDLATGEVVSSETETDGDLEFEFADEVDDIGDDGVEGFRVFDPESGEELMAIAFDDVTFTDLDADGRPIEDTQEMSEPTEPTMWIVAAAGESLIVERIDGVANDVYVTSAVAQDAGVLVAKSDGTMIRFVPEG